MTTEMRETVMNSFVFRVVKGGKLGYSTLYDFLESTTSWILVPLASGTEEGVILDEVEGISRECGNSDLLLGKAEVSPKGSFDLLIRLLGDSYWRITTSRSNKRSYYEYVRGRAPVGEASSALAGGRISVADFANEGQLIATRIGLECFVNRDHRFVRKLMSIMGSMESADLEFVNGFFYEVKELVNRTYAKVSKEELEGLISKQRVLLDMFEARKFLSRQEKEELVIRKEELPEWIYESEAGSTSLPFS